MSAIDLFSFFAGSAAITMPRVFNFVSSRGNTQTFTSSRGSEPTLISSTFHGNLPMVSGH